MTRVAYYPGCALKERSSHLERPALGAAEKLGFELDELDSWTCCGAVPPPSEERIMNLVAPIRILKDVRDSGDDVLVTICDFCYNSLKRANHRIRTSELDRKRLNAFLRENQPRRDYLPSTEEDYEDYVGEVKVMHLLEYLRDVVGFEEIARARSRDLSALRLAPYYGCVMLRPEDEIGLDSVESPTIIEAFLESLGAQAVAYPYRTVCCGSYLSVSFPESSARLCNNIISSAADRGADAIVVSCPLCFYNLDSRQKLISELYPGAKSMPILYFTQVLAMAMDLDAAELGLDKHQVDPGPVVRKALGTPEGDGDL
jgi:heterodisulfide reductase subunit B